MKLVIDLQSCQSGSRLGGIGRYSLQLAKAMIQQARNHDVWILLNNQLPSTISTLRNEFSNIIPQDHIISFETIDRTAELFTTTKFRTYASELIREEFIARLKPDIIHITSLFEGLGDDVVTSIGGIQPRHRTSVTLYDLIPWVQKDLYLSNPITLSHYSRKLDSLKRSDQMLSISEFSRQEGLKILDVPPEKIINISSAIGDYFKKINVSRDDNYLIRDKFSIRKKYLMYTGSFDQRKNHKLLIEAFSLVPKRIRSEFQLLIVGNGSDTIYLALINHAKQFGLKPTDLIFTGHIDDRTLLNLYNMCHLFVFPSLFEGFGLPVLEAMSCGVPSIGSNCTSIPEVIGRSDALFDPTSARSISSKITAVLQNKNFYNSLMEHATIQSRKFSWESSAKKALAAFEEIVDRGGAAAPPPIQTSISIRRSNLIRKIALAPEAKSASDGDLLEVAGAIATNEFLMTTLQSPKSMNHAQLCNEYIGVITTWNTKCGIASYTKFLTSNFPHTFHVLAPHTAEVTDNDEINVLRCWEIGENDDLKNLSKSISISGVSTILIQFNYGFFNFDSISRFIELQNRLNRPVFIEFHSTVDPPEHIMNKKLESLAYALKLCKGLFVHSTNDVERLSQIGITNNVTIVPLGVQQVVPAEVSYVRDSNDFVIATYGYFLPHKGLLEMVHAFAALSKENSTIKLLMINAEYPVPESKHLIEKAQTLIYDLGISEKVTMVTDYLSDAQTLGYLSYADLIVYPYQQTGESSSAAVRHGLVSGVPVAVTPLSIFSDVSEIVHFFTGTNIAEIAAGVNALMMDIQSNSQRIQRVRSLCEQWTHAHDYSSISRYMYNIITTKRALENDYALRMIFTPWDNKIGTVIGSFTDSSISSSGNEGALLYGPYLKLMPDHYRIRCYGSATGAHDISKTYKLRLLHTDGTHEVEFKHVISIDYSPELLFEVEFIIEVALINFEVQILAIKGVPIEVTSYEILKSRTIY